MAYPRTTHTLRVRSYEIRPGGRVGSASFLNWFQEAAFANSSELGYGPEKYAEMGLSWVMRENDLEILQRPGLGETIHITTWIADVRRVSAYRQYEARADDGTLLARCNTQWAMLDLTTLRPTRIPEAMTAVFQPARDFVLPTMEWPSVKGEAITSQHLVPFYEEDEMAHVNNAVYLNWIEESARRAAAAQGRAMPTFRRHLLTYRQPAHCGNLVTFQSCLAPHGDGLAWSHEVRREGELLIRAQSLSGPLPEGESP